MPATDAPLLSRRSFLQTTGAAGTAAALGGVASADRRTGEDGSRILVGVEASTTLDDAERRLPDDVEVVDRLPALRTLVARIDDGDSVYSRTRAAAEVRSRSFAKYVENERRYWASAAPDDPRFEDQYVPQQVSAPRAWEASVDASSVTVAVVDQGVEYDHPDLEDRFGSRKGRDFVDDDGDPYPDDPGTERHGTAVAGVAAATTDDGEGIAGVSDARLLSCRALDENGGGSLADISAAIRWAADQGADVINLSLGGGGYAETMKNAVSYALDSGALPVCAAGSSGDVQYPAKFQECVAVSAVDADEDLADFSSTGEAIDVAAPGVDVLTTLPGPGQSHGRRSGTSFACAAASGVAAIGAATRPDGGPDVIRERLKASAVDVDLPDEQQGAGRVDVVGLVPQPPPVGPTAAFSVSDGTPTVGETVTFDASASSHDGGRIERYDWSLGDGTTATGEVVDHAYRSAGEFGVELAVVGDDGRTDTDSEVVRVAPEEGDCSVTERRTESGSLTGTGDATAYSYRATLSDPCELSVSLSGDEETDFDLYLTLDGRTPTTDDYDRRSYDFGSDESIAVDGPVESGQSFGILVHSYRGSGGYELSIVEAGSGDGRNRDPSASIEGPSDPVPVGETVTFDASASSDPDGSIERYEWTLGDGTTATGEAVDHAYGSAGEYEVELAVHDGDGGTDATTTTVTVERHDPPECGADREESSADGYLWSPWDDDVYRYATRLSDPCQVTVALDGPGDADFDLYVTTDGRSPSPDDYDRRSVTQDSQERVLVEDADSGTEVGILVDAWSGSGSYTLSVTELGR